HFKAGLLEDAVKAQHMDASLLKDPFGKPWTTDSLAKLDKGFTADRLAQGITANRIQQVGGTFINYTQQTQAKFLKNQERTSANTSLADAAKAQGLGEMWLKDAWGEPLRLTKTDKKRDHKTGWSQLDYYELVSTGPDGKFGTKDDIKVGDPNSWYNAGIWWLGDDARKTMLAQQGGFGRRAGDMWKRRGFAQEEMLMLGAPGGMGGGGAFPRAAAAEGAPRPMAPMRELTKFAGAKGEAKNGGPAGSAAPTMRIREYFPETMLWQPALITDDKGVAILPVTFADSITTWRLTASASSKGGLLGGITAPLRVFQDFFVDLDLPVSLTMNDEVAFPVAVYNYLKEPQTVKLELKKENWFELVDTAGATRTLDLKPNEVTAVKFRIR